MELTDINPLIDANLFDYLKCFAGKIGNLLQLPDNDPMVTLVYSGTPLTFNRIFGADFRRIPERKIVQMINKIRDYYKERNSSSLWLVRSSSNPVNLGNLLTKCQFSYQTDWKDMILCLNKERTNPPIKENSGYQVINAVNEDQFKTWIDIFCAGFGYEKDRIMYDKLFESMGFGENLPYQYYLGFYNDTPASVCFSYTDRDATGFYCLTTLKELRRKGCATAVVNKILNNAISRQCKILFTQVDKVDMNSQSFYKKMGFNQGGVTKIYGFKP